MSAPSPAPLLLRSARLTTGETADVLVAEGRIVRRGPSAALHWARREPVRRLRNRVLDDPRLYAAADRVLKRAASVRTRVAPGAVRPILRSAATSA